MKLLICLAGFCLPLFASEFSITASTSDLPSLTCSGSYSVNCGVTGAGSSATGSIFYDSLSVDGILHAQSGASNAASVSFAAYIDLPTFWGDFLISDYSTLDGSSGPFAFSMTGMDHCTELPGQYYAEVCQVDHAAGQPVSLSISYDLAAVVPEASSDMSFGFEFAQMPIAATVLASLEPRPTELLLLGAAFLALGIRPARRCLARQI